MDRFRNLKIFGGFMYYTFVTRLLGGKKTLGLEVRNQMDLIDLSIHGIPKASLLHLAEYIGSPVGKMADILPVTERTIQRYRPQKHFNSFVSEHILHIAEVIARGLEVFEKKDDLLNWLVQPSTALGGRSPRILLRSRFGANMVLDELTRIEHGVVS
jgi:putative toxin-antitoxin system antitoxin component (TIGR02293 family)